MALNHNILLEAGTNEFEIVEFIINGDKPYHFCINVAKVMEVILFPEIVRVPDAHNAIIGTANIRQNLVPIIDLGSWLTVKDGTEPEDSYKNAKVIVTYFNGAYNGFLVDEVIRIHRITWADIRDYSSMTDFKLVDTVLGVVTIGGKLIQLLDFERIVGDINPSTMASGLVDIDMTLASDRAKKSVFLAEDSMTIRKLLESSLLRAGYNVEVFDNGGALLNRLKSAKPDIIITDLEMPGTSGDYVVRKVREVERYKDIPIVVFSSMASDENAKKLKSIGADTFIGKPEFNYLIQTIDEYALSK